MQSLAFVVEALDNLRWIDGKLPHVSGLERDALLGARAELVKVIESACRLQVMPEDPSPLPHPFLVEKKNHAA